MQRLAGAANWVRTAVDIWSAMKSIEQQVQLIGRDAQRVRGTFKGSRRLAKECFAAAVHAELCVCMPPRHERNGFAVSGSTRVPTWRAISADRSKQPTRLLRGQLRMRNELR